LRDFSKLLESNEFLVETHLNTLFLFESNLTDHPWSRAVTSADEDILTDRMTPFRSSATRNGTLLLDDVVTMRILSLILLLSL